MSKFAQFAATLSMLTAIFCAGCRGPAARNSADATQLATPKVKVDAQWWDDKPDAALVDEVKQRREAELAAAARQQPAPVTRNVNDNERVRLDPVRSQPDNPAPRDTSGDSCGLVSDQPTTSGDNAAPRDASSYNVYQNIPEPPREFDRPFHETWASLVQPIDERVDSAIPVPETVSSGFPLPGSDEEMTRGINSGEPSTAIRAVESMPSPPSIATLPTPGEQAAPESTRPLPGTEIDALPVAQQPVALPTGDRKSFEQIRLRGLVEDGTGAMVALLEIGPAQTIHVRQGDQFDVSVDSEETTLRVVDITNRAVRIQTGEQQFMKVLR